MTRGRDFPRQPVRRRTREMASWARGAMLSPSRARARFTAAAGRMARSTRSARTHAPVALESALDKWSPVAHCLCAAYVHGTSSSGGLFTGCVLPSLPVTGFLTARSTLDGVLDHRFARALNSFSVPLRMPTACIALTPPTHHVLTGSLQAFRVGHAHLPSESVRDWRA